MLSALLGAACTSIPDLPAGMLMPESATSMAGDTPAPAADTAAAAGGGSTRRIEGDAPAPLPNAGTGVAGAIGDAGRAQGAAGVMGMPVMNAGGMAASSGMGLGGAPPMVDAGIPIPMGPGDAGMPPPAGTSPKLPVIRGACPEFRDGTTIVVAGHSGITITAGTPGKGGPLLFYWHGTGGSPTEVARMLTEATRSEIVAMGGIIAAFDGKSSAGTGADCSGTKAHNQADFNAADQIAACAVENHGIDPRRIYTTGCSAGGLQSGCMALMRSSYIAAAATNSGGVLPPESIVIDWQDTHAPAILTMHGGSQDMVFLSFSMASATLDMRAKSHGSFVVNCDHGEGHCGIRPDMSQAAWQFLKDHPWGVGKSPWAAGLPAGVPAYCQIY